MQNITKQDKFKKTIWTLEQQQLLSTFYQQYGPVWTLISTKFSNKTEIALKNKFNSYLRKAIKLLSEHQRKQLKKINKGIGKIINVMLQFSYQVQKLLQKQKLTPNNDSLLLRFRSQLIRLCFHHSQFSSQDLTDFSYSIKNLNTKFRCFGAFKRKCVKGWKLSLPNLWIICQYDKVCAQDLITLQNSMKQKISIQLLKNLKKTKCTSTSVNEDNYSLPDLDIDYPSGICIERIENLQSQCKSILGGANIQFCLSQVEKQSND